MFLSLLSGGFSAFELNGMYISGVITGLLLVFIGLLIMRQTELYSLSDVQSLSGVIGLVGIVCSVGLVFTPSSAFGEGVVGVGFVFVLLFTVLGVVAERRGDGFEEGVREGRRQGHENARKQLRHYVDDGDEIAEELKDLEGIGYDGVSVRGHPSGEKQQSEGNE